MTAWPQAGLVMSACLALGLLGPIDPSAAHLLSAGGIAVWCAAAALEAPAGRLRGLRALAAGLAGAGGVALLGRSQGAPAGLAVMGAVVLCVPCRGRRGATVFLGALLAAAVALERVSSPAGVCHALSLAVSRAAGAATGQSLALGPSASGLGLLGVVLLLLAAFRGRTSAPASRMLACVVLWPVWVAALPSLAAWRPEWLFGDGGLLNMAREHPHAAAQSLTRALFHASWIWLGVLCAVGLAFRKDGDAGPVRPSWMWAAPAAVLACAVSALVCFEAVWPRPDRRPGGVVLVEDPSFDLAIPSRERLGIGASGMFGLLGRYLELDGHGLSTHRRPLSAETLEEASVVMVVLPTTPFQPPELARLDRYVRSGGSLLVLADHTDLLGSMGPVNQIASPHGIEALFDSAYPASREWRGCLRPSLRGEPFHATGIGTGCSLRIRRGVRPIVTGRYALADAGDRGNAGYGGFLGDYAYQPGERLGDLVLAAEARPGSGRLVVFGDTSSFQNPALPWSFPFVASLFEELSRPAQRWRLTVSFAAGLLAAALLAVVAAGRRTAAAVWSIVLLGASCAVQAAAVPQPAVDRLEPDAPVALVDDGRLSGFSRQLWTDGSIGGLLANLQRAGMLPIVVREKMARRLPGPEALGVLVAPRASMTQAEALDLAAHIDRGGDVLVAAGGPDAEAVAPLLSLHGLRILGTMPLGPVPVRPDMREDEYRRARAGPQLRNAWPIERSGTGVTLSRFSAFGHDVVLESRSRQPGGGRLIVIADPELPTDRVLENEWAAWEGNVDLLAAILAGRER
ncbi:MAG TPA: DUF4350 domain-containing protein [Candidatus Polarisedimenticolia bacterium]|nr:DUF4350 domain-containing protein [Candidatus Polarisedimenticolia bacterium]